MRVVEQRLQLSIVEPILRFRHRGAAGFPKFPLLEPDIRPGPVMKERSQGKRI